MFIAKLGKWVEYYCSSIFDESGRAVYLLEVLRIIEKKPLGTSNEWPERQRPKAFEFVPFSIMLIVEGKIVLANEQTLRLFGKTFNLEEVNDDLITNIKQRIEKMLNNNVTINVFDYQFVFQDTVSMELKVNLSLLNYAGKKAVLSFIRIVNDNTKGRELYAAADFQKQVILKPFPFPDKAELETLYMPSKIVSGDFYFFQRINKDLLVGIIGDVSGKGITAALSISAFNVLFHEAALANHNPLEIVKVLNEKIVDYMDEKYVAVCCFSLDFAKQEAKIVGAGINQFIFFSHSGKGITRTVKGPFLGMFENCDFDQLIMRFQQGDKLYFFTDGLDHIMLDRNFSKKWFKLTTIAELFELLTFSDLFTANELRDDCTLLALVIK